MSFPNYKKLLILYKHYKIKINELLEEKTMTIKYIIKLKDDTPINQDFEMNKRKIFYYDNYRFQYQQDFEIPIINIDGGGINIHYYRVNDRGEPVDNNGIVVESPELAQSISETEIFVYEGSTSLAYNLSGYEITAHNIGGYTYNNYYIDKIVGEDKTVKVPVTVSNPNRDVYFGYILNKIGCTLNIIKSAETEDNESYIFEIIITNLDYKFLEYFYRTVQENSLKILKHFRIGKYDFEEIINWLFSYGNLHYNVNDYILNKIG